MTVITSAEKRARAAGITSAIPATPTRGNLAVVWDSTFDRLCYEISAAGLARKHPERYGSILAELTDSTGCTEDELVAHGFKVRSVLYFAEDRLARQGILASLFGDQQHQFRLAPVTQSF
jgi:hypothetical protein